jgi:pimeloyl-ACP methyl ester carboxylesterase
MIVLYSTLALIATLLILGVAVLLVATWRVRGHFFDSGGLRIHYTDEGAGVPVILVHGFAATSDQNWRLPGVIRALRCRYRVISMDVRGHGLSGKPHEKCAYGPEMLEDIRRLMDHLGIEKAHLLGYSMGGFISLAFVGRYPERLYSAVIGGAGWYPRNEYPGLLQTVPASLDAGTGMLPIVAFMEPEGEWFRGLRIFIANNFLTWYTDNAAMARRFESMMDFEGSEEQLDANKVPVLVLMGSEDPLRAAADHLAARGGSHQVVYIEGGNHLTTLSLPKYRRQFLQQVLAFLEAHSPPQTAAEPPVTTRECLTE